jgi:hypothetical protein
MAKDIDRREFIQGVGLGAAGRVVGAGAAVFCVCNEKAARRTDRMVRLISTGALMAHSPE